MKSCIKFLFFSLISAFCLIQACSPLQQDKRVNAQMFLKDTLGKEGVIECFAEGKHYGIRPVQEQTFYPGDDSFHRMHHHGVALESEQIAYRIYFDKRQTVDVYAKRSPRLELSETLWYPNDKQLAQGFGDDVLKVGNTIGVGTVRLWDETNHKLQNIDKFESKTQRILSVSDTVASVEMEVKGMQTGDMIVDMITRYTIFAGHRDMLCEVFVSDSLENLVTGVQSIGDGDTFINRQLKPVPGDYGVLLASWGTDWPVNDTIKYPKETIGIAVSIPYDYAGEIIKDTKQTLVGLRQQPINESCQPYAVSDSERQKDHYCYYCNFQLLAVSLKENNPPARDSQQFFHYLTR